MKRDNPAVAGIHTGNVEREGSTRPYKREQITGESMISTTPDDFDRYMLRTERKKSGKACETGMGRSGKKYGGIQAPQSNPVPSQRGKGREKEGCFLTHFRRKKGRPRTALRGREERSGDSRSG